MPYMALRKFKMFGREFAHNGNAYGLPHIVPTDLAERVPRRSLLNMLSRGMLRQVEGVTEQPNPASDGLEADPRVTKEGKGWWLVDGERFHGQVAAQQALVAVGG